MDGIYAPRIFYGSLTCPVLFVGEDEAFCLSEEFGRGSWIRHFHNTQGLAGHTFFLTVSDMNMVFKIENKVS